MPATWFRRMGDIPGLDDEPPVPIDRQSLKHHDATPEMNRYEFEGRVKESLAWDYPADEDGEVLSTSASPAHEFAFGSDDGLATATLLKRLWEGLELPGEPSDYHFGIQSVVGMLWRRRAAQPEVVAWVEYLHWLDIRLLRAVPDAVRDEFAAEYPGRAGFYRVNAFHALVELYMREGFVQEALAVAHIAREFEQGERDLAALEERIASLRAEDGD